MTIEEAIKEIEDSGKMLGMGDYVDVEALKVAVKVMKDYQKVVYGSQLPPLMLTSFAKK